MDRRNRRHGSRDENGVAALLRDEKSLRIQIRDPKNAQDAGSLPRLSLSPEMGYKVGPRLHEFVHQ